MSDGWDQLGALRTIGAFQTAEMHLGIEAAGYRGNPKRTREELSERGLSKHEIDLLLYDANDGKHDAKYVMDKLYFYMRERTRDSKKFEEFHKVQQEFRAHVKEIYSL